MRIEADTQLDFCDVLIRPRRSTVLSRAGVDLNREFLFPTSKRYWKGIPIILANMDVTGNFANAVVASKYGLITALHKFYSIQDMDRFVSEADSYCLANVMYTTGIRDDDITKLMELKDARIIDLIGFINIDVPNGYVSKVLNICRSIRYHFPDHSPSPQNG